jgi:Fic family protein
LTEEEAQLKKSLWENAIPLTRNPNLIKKVEQKSILINNLIEIKNASKTMRTEFAKEFIYNSNNIEGSRIPKDKLFELIEKGKTSHSNKNEIIEVENSIKAFDYIDNKFTFTLRGISGLYNVLTKGMLLENGAPYPHGFKKVPIIVGNSNTTAPNKVQPELLTLVAWNKTHAKTMYPPQRAFEFHLRYESTHPFRDANGRSGRLIMNKILMQNNYPPIIVYKENKEAYFNAINSAREGDKPKYYQFMLEQMEKTYNQMIETLNKD